MQYRVVEYFPDKGFGIALLADPFMLRKIIVRDRNVISGRLQIGSLIECDHELLPNETRYNGRRIKVLK